MAGWLLYPFLPLKLFCPLTSSLSLGLFLSHPMLLLPSLSLSGFWPSHSLAVANTFHPSHRPLLLKATRARAKQCRPDPRQGDESEPPIPASPPSQKDREEAERQKNQKWWAEVGTVEVAKAMTKLRMEGAWKEGKPIDQQAIDNMLKNAKHPMVRTFMEKFIKQEMERFEGKGAMGGNESSPQVPGGNNANETGKGGSSAATDGLDKREGEEERSEREGENESKEAMRVGEEISEGGTVGVMEALELMLPEITVEGEKESTTGEGATGRKEGDDSGKTISQGRGREEGRGMERTGEGSADMTPKDGAQGEVDEEKDVENSAANSMRGGADAEQERSGRVQEEEGEENEHDRDASHRRSLRQVIGQEDGDSKRDEKVEEWEATREEEEEHAREGSEMELGVEFVNLEGDSRGRRMAEVVGGADAEREEDAKIKSIRCTQLQVREPGEVMLICTAPLRGDLVFFPPRKFLVQGRFC